MGSPRIDPNVLLDLMEAEPRLTTRQLATRLNISTSSVHRISALYEVRPAAPNHGRRVTTPDFADPLITEFFVIHDASPNSDQMVCGEAGVALTTITSLRTRRTKTVNLTALHKLFRVYGYRLVKERIQND